MLANGLSPRRDTTYLVKIPVHVQMDESVKQRTRLPPTGQQSKDSDLVIKGLRIVPDKLDFCYSPHGSRSVCFDRLRARTISGDDATEGTVLKPDQTVVAGHLEFEVVPSDLVGASYTLALETSEGFYATKIEVIVIVIVIQL